MNKVYRRSTPVPWPFRKLREFICSFHYMSHGSINNIRLLIAVVHTRDLKKILFVRRIPYICTECGIHILMGISSYICARYSRPYTHNMYKYIYVYIYIIYYSFIGGYLKWYILIPLFVGIYTHIYIYIYVFT